MDDILSRLLNNQLISLTLNKIGRKSRSQSRRQHRTNTNDTNNDHTNIKDDSIAVGVDLTGTRITYTIDTYNTSNNTIIHHSDSNQQIEPNSASVISNQLSSSIVHRHDPSNNHTSQHFNFGYSTMYRSFVSALSINKSLTYLSLGHNSLDSNAIQLLCDVLINNTSITHLCIPLNKIELDGYKSIAHTFKLNHTVTYLDLSGNSMLDDGAYCIADMIQHNRSLQTLDLTWCTFYVAGARAIAKSLKYNKTIKYINVSKNYVLHEGCTAFADTLQYNKSLRKLDLSNNMLYSDGAKSLALGLCNQLTTSYIISSNQSFLTRSTSNNSNHGNTTQLCNQLTELNVSLNEIGNAGVKYISAALRSNNVLHTLILNENIIGFDGAMALSSVLKKSISELHAPNVTHLYLNDNDIGVKGADAIARSLVTNKSLVKLHLSANDIYAPGIKSLCKGLINNTTLTELNLSWNRFGVDGMKYIATMLLQNNTLRKLYLAHNRIFDDGCELLAHALAANKGLHYIDITGNRIKAKGIEFLAQLLPQNHSLLVLQYDQTVTSSHRDNNNNHQQQIDHHQINHMNLNDHAVPAGPAQAAAAALGGLAAQQNNIVAPGEQQNGNGLEIVDVDGQPIVVPHDIHAHNNNLHVAIPAITWSTSADVTINNVLTRNAHAAIKRNKLSILMGFHHRVGRDSALYHAFNSSSIGDISIVNEIFSYLYNDISDLSTQINNPHDREYNVKLNGSAYQHIYSTTYYSQ